MAKLTITAKALPDGLPVTIKGRIAWALLELVRAGQRGCTPIDNPGPRWSAYVFNLRTEFGLSIETIHENHDGPFAGTHARYVLQTAIEILGSNGPEPKPAKILQVHA